MAAAELDELVWTSAKVASNNLALCMLLLQAGPGKLNHTFSLGKQHKHKRHMQLVAWIMRRDQNMQRGGRGSGAVAVLLQRRQRRQ